MRRSGSRPREDAGSSAGPRRDPERWVWIEGSVCRAAEVRLPALDPAAREPEGLFETIRVSNGAPSLWQRHYRRLARSAAEFAFPALRSAAELEAAMARLFETARLSEAALRITVTRPTPETPDCWIEAEPLEARLWPGARGGRAAAIFASQPFAPGPLGRHKTTTRAFYDRAREEAREREADEALLVSPDGLVLEGTVTNVFAVVGGEALTPPLSAGILPGVMREWVLETCREHGIETREGPIHRDWLAAADEMFLTNAVQGVVPLARLEGRELPSSAMGRNLMEARDREDHNFSPRR